VIYKFHFAFFLLFILFCVQAGFADADPDEGDFWICPSGEAAFYSLSGVSYGGGFALGYGRGSSIGIKAAWFPGSDGASVLEINCLMRFYFNGKKAYSGPFLQFMGGPVLFFSKESGISIPSKIGVFSAGMGLGWRILILDKVFIEPNIRGGFPYLVGAGLSAGVRF